MASDDTTLLLRRPEYLRRYFAATRREYATGKNIKCPNAAAHAHGDANASARIYENADGALVKCYGCGSTFDVFDLWRLDNGGTFAEAKAALCDRFGIARDNAERAEVRPLAGAPVAEIETANVAAAGRAQATKPDEQTAEYVNECALNLQAGEDGEAGRAYLAGRGISADTARRFNVGYDAKLQAVIIPQGAGYMARSIKPDAEQKDKCRYYPKGAPRVLFNGEAIVQAAKDGIPVFIVEGEIDALSIAEVGGVAVSTGGTSGIGKAVKAAAQIGRGVYVPCMDRDKSGEEAQAALVAKLREIGGAVYVYADAPKILLPDEADGTHHKDANEALQRDAAAFRARVAEVVSKAQEYAKAEEAKNKPYFTLDELGPLLPEEENPRALFKRGYLRKGHGLILASTAGAGKSTLSLQLALHWVLGDSCLGFEPVRPLRIAVIQSEDDQEELQMFRESMRQGMAEEGYTPERVEKAITRMQVRKDFLGKRGAEFTKALGAMQNEYHYDLVMVNPLKTYFKGELANNEEVDTFFREWIDPVIKNPATECGICFFHHFTKPAKGRDAANFGRGPFAQYCMQGAAGLNDWARAVVILLPFENAPTFWTLTAAKRWKPLGWTDADGNPTRDKDIAYSDNIVYWREPSAEEIAAAKRGTTPSRKQETDEERKRREDLELRQAMAEIVSWLQHTESKKKNDIYEWCDKNESALFKGFRNHTVKKQDGTYYPKRPCYLAYELVIENPMRYGVGYQTGKYKNGKPYSLYGGVASVAGGVSSADAGEVAHLRGYDGLSECDTATGDDEARGTEAPDESGDEQTGKEDTK